jgi:eukaryotic-like serine/threonine-protein kinase
VPQPLLLRTTVVQAFAHTVVDGPRSDLPKGSRRLELVDSIPPPGSLLPELEDVVGQHYRLVRVLGQGMFGKVYVAQRIDVPEHQVALKLMPRSVYQGRNVERELVMLATVGHPHVVQLKDHGTTPDYVWLTMPVYQGETLAERLVRGPLSLRDAHDIFLPIARGLSALHAAGLRHQDVKPENIYLATFNGRVHPILLDLGVAAEREATFVAGTALYAAPEQVAILCGGVPGIVPVSEKMDTYGLATTLLVALVGPAFFPGERARDRDDLAKAHAQRAQRPIEEDALLDLQGRPRALLQEAFAKWMALEEADRPSMSEVAEQLDVLLESEREEAELVVLSRAREKASFQRLQIVLGAMLLIGLGGAGIVYSKRETLRVASELESARKKGSESFDKLETCVASHEMARAETAACLAARHKDQADFKQTLDDVMRTGTTSEAERAKQLQGYAARIRGCEDAAAAAQQKCSDDEARLRDEGEKQKASAAAVASERDEGRADVEKAKGEIEALKKRIGDLESGAKTCDEERESCKRAAASAAAALGAAGSAPGKAAPAGSSAADAGAAAAIPARVEGTVTPVVPPAPSLPATAAVVPPAAP